MDSVFLTLFHILVFVYWLGGDLGAFYASTKLTNTAQPIAARVLAGQIIHDIDLAPRFSLILAAPTGLALAQSKGWLSIDWPWIVLGFAFAIAWIGCLWQVHRSHDASPVLAMLDKTIRLSLLALLLITGGSGLIGAIQLPTFLALKLIILGTTIGLGLYIRTILKEFGPAFVQLANGKANDDINLTIKTCLGRARPVVMLIWALLIIAAWLGIATPS